MADLPPKVVFQAAVRDWPLRDVVKLCGWSLSTYMGAAGLAWPSMAAVASGAGCHERTARRALRELEDMGWLLVDHSPGRAPNRYRVNPGAIQPGSNAGQPGQTEPSTRTELRPPTRAELRPGKGLEGKYKGEQPDAAALSAADLAAAARAARAQLQQQLGGAS